MQFIQFAVFPNGVRSPPGRFLPRPWPILLDPTLAGSAIFSGSCKSTEPPFMLTEINMILTPLSKDDLTRIRVRTIELRAQSRADMERLLAIAERWAQLEATKTASGTAAAQSYL